MDYLEVMGHVFCCLRHVLKQYGCHSKENIERRRGIVRKLALRGVIITLIPVR